MSPRAVERSRRVRAGLAAALAAAVVLVTACSSGSEDTEPRPGPSQTLAEAQPPTPAPTAPTDPTKRPNIVLVLMDDFSMDLVPSLAVGKELTRRGAWYPNAYVVDSLCCVSRASTLTGQYPHQTGVRANSSQVHDARGRLGGYPAFEAGGNLARSVNVALQQSGYRTGFVGKYLNEYEYNPGWDIPSAPPGWTQFNVLYGSAYDGWGFDSSYLADGVTKVEHHPTPPASASPEEKDAAYAGQVIEDKALAFLTKAQQAGKPYYLQVNPFATHAEVEGHGAWPDEPHFPAAFADRAPDGRSNSPQGNCGPPGCADFDAARLPGFGDRAHDNRPLTEDGTPARAWNQRMFSRSPGQYSALRRDRARMAQSINRTVQRILDTVDDNTYVILTSDNGFHLGQLGLDEGKGTAYDSDVRVPLWIIGPGVAPGTRSEWASNIDLAPTFEAMAGIRREPYRSGISLLPSLQDATSRTRTHVFFEHTSEPGVAGDPDRVRNGWEIDRIPSYLAVRGEEGLLIRNNLRIGAGAPEYGWEFYSYDQQPWERTNQFGAPRYADRIAALRAELERFEDCDRIRGDARVTRACRP